ncbi:MAG TPA: mechanosensitive ion channel family protein [Holophaga sp.]|nr:mechanosensitive ion channel family protein [Holophaga sp.]
MFRDLRSAVSGRRRLAAYGLLGLSLILGAYTLATQQHHPSFVRAATVLVAVVGTYLGIRLFTWLLLDPLLANRRTAVPGFARDLVVFTLYAAAAIFLLRRIAGVEPGALLGTGAIAAAVVGLSLQDTLGNLFAGMSLHLDESFQVGDWIEVTGTLRGGSGQETFVGQVETMTWRSVHLVTENGDTTLIPNRAIGQAVVTNLYAPSGLHRRTLRVTVEPHAGMHRTLAALEQALGGIPHLPHRKPEVVSHSFDMGGIVLELRWWSLGWRHGRAGAFLAVRLAQTVLNRLGVSLLGPHGATTGHIPPPVLREGTVKDLLRKMDLPPEWAPEFQQGLVLRRAVPGEGIIREGDPGETLFMVMAGTLHVVKVAERTEPFTGLYWDVVAELGPGDWFGEGSLLTGSPRSATIVAAAPCELVEVPKAALERCLQGRPEILDRLADLMASREPRREEAPRPAAAHEEWLERIRGWFQV